jgi:hypothetical protein
LPEQDLYATETHHAEEILDVVLPADDQAAKMVQPSKESFHSPTPAVAPQWATVRGLHGLNIDNNLQADG